ncbi:MAG: DUF1571 domain-containing protein [Phycisphaerales bacterium]|nr:DUF1571 domain-containing protein [Phycisphaerales bacterium]
MNRLLRLARFGMALVIVSLGCATRKPGIATNPLTATGPARLDADELSRLAVTAEEIAAAPDRFLGSCLAAAERLDHYSVTFTRMERRGLLNLPQGPERIAVLFRRSPFSVRMMWLDEHVKYGESTYVEGVDGSRVRFTPRRGVFGLPPPLVRVDPQTPVAWGEARRPVTDFGVETLLRESLAALREAEETVRVTVAGAVAGGADGAAAILMRLRYPDESRRAPIQDLLIDLDTLLPLATWVRFPDERLDAYYYYEDLNPDAVLRDDDFLLIAERPEQTTSATAEQP